MSKMKLFEGYIGSYIEEYDDDDIRLRFTCKKRAGELPNGRLADILNKLGLNEHNTFWELKQKIWNLLNISEPPIKLRQEKEKILDKNINNAGWVNILRNKEGILLLNALNLNPTSTTKELEDGLFNKIMSVNGISMKSIFSNNLSETSILLKSKKQIILFGPPGTGKTYKTKEYAVNFLDSGVR